MNPLILELISLFTPMIREAIDNYKARHDGQEPTDADVIAEFNANVEKYLGEGSAWKAAHPNA